MTEITDNPFRYINALCLQKYMEVEDDYKPFLVDRFFSYFIDSVLIAEMATRFSPDLDKQLHYDFYFAQIRRKKRSAKWYKPIEDEYISSICKYYDVSEKTAYLYAKAMPDELKEEIKKRVNEIA